MNLHDSFQGAEPWTNRSFFLKAKWEQTQHNLHSVHVLDLVTRLENLWRTNADAGRTCELQNRAQQLNRPNLLYVMTTSDFFFSPSSSRPTGGACVPKQRPRRLHDSVLRLPAGRGRPCANRGPADPEGEYKSKARSRSSLV